MMSGFFNQIYDFLKGFEGYEPVDFSLGKQQVDNIIAKATSIAEQKKWFDSEVVGVENEIFLDQHEFSKKLVWFVYFVHSFDEKETIETEISLMRFALVKIEDETGEVIFADFIRPQLF